MKWLTRILLALLVLFVVAQADQLKSIIAAHPEAARSAQIPKR